MTHGLTRALFLLAYAVLLGAPSCALDGPSAERARQWCLSGAQPRPWDDAGAQARRAALCAQIRPGMTMGQIEGLAATTNVVGMVDIQELIRMGSQCPGGRCGTNLCTASATTKGSDGDYTTHSWFCTRCPNRGSLSYSPDPNYLRARVSGQVYESCAPGDQAARSRAGGLAADLVSERVLNKTFAERGFDMPDLAREMAENLGLTTRHVATINGNRMLAQDALEMRVRPGYPRDPPHTPLNTRVPLPSGPTRLRSATPPADVQKARQQRLDALGRALDAQRGL